MLERFKKSAGTAQFGKMASAVRLWGQMYENNAPWLSGQIKSLNLTASICAEIAKLTVIEFKSGLFGSERADALDKAYRGFLSGIRRAVEFACAKGGVVFKPYVSENGIKIETIGTEFFEPLRFDTSGRLVSAAFYEQIRAADTVYTREETHGMRGTGVYHITNRAYIGSVIRPFEKEIPLHSVPEWNKLDERILISGISRPLFAYFRMPFANNIDQLSPLGVSAFSRACELIREADEQYSRLIWEFEGSELAVDASADVLKNDKMPRLSGRLFRRLDTVDPDFYSVFSPNIRDASLLNGLNAILRKIEFNCGLAFGTVSDVQSVQKTAQEIRDSKQRSYATVSDIQKSLQAALEDLIYALDVQANIYSLCPAGEVKSFFEFDDSIVRDSQTEFEERLQMVQAGVIRPELLTSWYFGCDEEKAKSYKGITSTPHGDIQ